MACSKSPSVTYYPAPKRTLLLRSIDAKSSDIFKFYYTTMNSLFIGHLATADEGEHYNKIKTFGFCSFYPNLSYVDLMTSTLRINFIYNFIFIIINDTAIVI